MRRADNLNHLHVTIVLKSGNLNLLEPLGPVQACNGTALSFTFNSSSNAFATLGAIEFIKNEWSCTSFAPYILRGVDREHITLYSLT